LPVTGPGVGSVTLVGLVLVLLGVFLMVALRRRKTS
jgi:LPXTG-motif cell wall-anchored protein